METNNAVAHAHVGVSHRMTIDAEETPDYGSESKNTGDWRENAAGSEAIYTVSGKIGASTLLHLSPRTAGTGWYEIREK